MEGRVVTFLKKAPDMAMEYQTVCKFIGVFCCENISRIHAGNAWRLNYLHQV